MVEGWDFCCGGDVFALELRELVGDAPMRYLRYIRYNRYNRYIEPHNRKSVATLPAETARSPPTSPGARPAASALPTYRPWRRRAKAPPPTFATSVPTLHTLPALHTLHPLQARKSPAELILTADELPDPPPDDPRCVPGACPMHACCMPFV